jgi:hypothetical protein
MKHPTITPKVKLLIRAEIPAHNSPQLLFRLILHYPHSEVPQPIKNPMKGAKRPNSFLR